MLKKVVSKTHMSASRKKVPAASLKHRNQGLGIPMHIQMQFIGIHIDYYTLLVLNRVQPSLYYISIQLPLLLILFGECLLPLAHCLLPIACCTLHIGLAVALWSFYHTTGYLEAVARCVNFLVDADTTAAICGQLAGAFYT